MIPGAATNETPFDSRKPPTPCRIYLAACRSLGALQVAEILLETEHRHAPFQRLMHLRVYVAQELAEPRENRSPPLGRGRNFVHFDLESVYIGDGFEVSWDGPQRKRYWFDLRTGGLITEDGSYGGLASFQGRFFPLLGPDIDTRLFLSDPTSLNLTTAGLDLALVQHDYFGWSLYGKGAFFRGDIERNGFAYGSSFLLYPAPPASLRVRAGGISFENIDFAQLEAALTFHLGRWELFGGGMLLQSKRSRILTAETSIGVSW
jgi:hypothetical protein